jgi:adenylate cyclase class IV
MIEVEKKFILTNEQEKALIEGAEFLGEKRFIDIYYDDKEYILTSNDIWLRTRSGKFELKIPMNVSIKERVSDQYRELEDINDILNHFNFNTNKSLEDSLIEKGLRPFCEIETIRRKYRKEGFNIDLDVMDYGYTLAEIEYMTDDETKMEEITESIVEFAKKHNMATNAVVRGKVVEYLRRNDYKHFQALVDAGIIKPSELY